jgi:hypothetical protein
VIGVPFYVMDFLPGPIVTGELPQGLETAEARHALGLDLVDALVEIHAVDVRSPGVADFVREGSYLERQVRRFTQLWEVNRTRELPDVVEVGELAGGEHARAGAASVVVHGDYRIGQHDPRRRPAGHVYAPCSTGRWVAVGDPRADVGYLLATYSEAARRAEPARHLARHCDPGLSDQAGAGRSATSSGAAATSSRLRGSRRSRCGRRRFSARRSTGASSAASWQRRDTGAAASSRACHSSAETALALIE